MDNGSGSMTVLEWVTAMRKATKFAHSGPVSRWLAALKLPGLRSGQIQLPQEREIIWAWWGAEGTSLCFPLSASL